MTALLKPSANLDQSPPFLGVLRSARGLRWSERLSALDANKATALAQRHGVPEILARLLAARGCGIEDAGSWLDPTIKDLMPDPSSLRDMDAGAARLADAIKTGVSIALFGDYDVDGASSIALVARFLSAHGLSPVTYVPDRLREGYGPNSAALDRLIDGGAQLILLLDCGTNSMEVIAEARRRGVDIIVVDHHLAGIELPQATALINPNRLDDLSGQGHLSATGVAFLLLVATARTLRASGWYGAERQAPDLRGWLDLVALATVCDVVPLKGLNRAFVTKGLHVLRRRSNAGLRALADRAGLATELGAYHLGYVLGPRVNAGGRIGEASLGSQLLITDDEIEAQRLAELLERLNAERKALETSAIEEACADAEFRIDGDPDLPVLIATSDDWHKGVIGLVAARLVERFHRPAIVIAWNGEQGTGSARSIRDVDIGSAVRAALQRGLLLKGGGHAMAAGLTLQRAQLEGLEQYLADELRADVTAQRRQRKLAIDGALLPGGCTVELMRQLERAGPFGAGNPQPRFAFAAHRCMFAKPVGEGHLRCVLTAGDGSRIEAVAFRAHDTALGALILSERGVPLHVAGHLRLDQWRGREKVELVIEDAADPRAQRL